MKSERFDFIVNDTLKTAEGLLQTKNQHYNNEGLDEDRLRSFKTAAELQGVTPVTALAGMMAKHTVSIYDMAMSGDHYHIETWDEKIFDHINYLVLLRALINEEATTS